MQSGERGGEVMRALTLTQPWAGLVASGIKLVENRPRTMIKPQDFGKRFAIHASREIDHDVYARIAEIDPGLDLRKAQADARWYHLSRITSAVIAVATIDKVLTGGWDADAIAEHAGALSFSNGELLGPSQVRWFFGPVGYLLRDVVALREPVPCRGALGFWTLPPDVERAVEAQL
jgi:hypothetical protein